MAKKKWTVNCTWMMSGTDYVEADTAEEAGKIASSPDRPAALRPELHRVFLPD